MGSRLGRRVVHFMNLPIKLLMPSPPFDSIREIALKTIPSASKIEIRRVLESLYGFDVDDVRTLNMEGKKRKRGAYLAAKPDYKKAYVTLRSPLSLDPSLFPLKLVQEERDRLQKASKSGVLEQEGSGGAEGKGTHWLDERDHEAFGGSKKASSKRASSSGRKTHGGSREETEKNQNMFPWSSMRLWRGKKVDS